MIWLEPKIRLQTGLIDIFQKYAKVFKKWDKKTLLWIIKKYRFPITYCQTWSRRSYIEIKKDNAKGIGRKKIKEIIEAAKTSIGITEGLKFCFYRIWLILSVNMKNSQMI